MGDGNSMLKTLARKHDSSVSKMARKYKTTIDTPHGATNRRASTSSTSSDRRT
jgi:hypothetical protein